MAKKKMTTGEKMALNICRQHPEAFTRNDRMRLSRRIDAALRRAFRDGVNAAPLNRGEPVDAFGTKLATRYGVKL